MSEGNYPPPPSVVPLDPRINNIYRGCANIIQHIIYNVTL